MTGPETFFVRYDFAAPVARTLSSSANRGRAVRHRGFRLPPRRTKAVRRIFDKPSSHPLPAGTQAFFRTGGALYRPSHFFRTSLRPLLSKNSLHFKQRSARHFRAEPMAFPPALPCFGTEASGYECFCPWKRVWPRFTHLRRALFPEKETMLQVRSVRIYGCLFLKKGHALNLLHEDSRPVIPKKKHAQGILPRPRSVKILGCLSLKRGHAPLSRNISSADCPPYRQPSPPGRIAETTPNPAGHKRRPAHRATYRQSSGGNPVRTPR